ncbi:ribokinase [Phenylobacterium sp.]|uniref:ribokinase n=1 Tax=Phenylobacterium sp. TaxID=1871053 RepID=UPI0027307D7D|nr:ribokinase [Phenylobacterium sp.]MDP1873343.1 ribokinase [Phenylobacterium sp.]
MSVCVLGGVNLDHVARVADLPRPGETVASRSLIQFPGGKGANQAVAAACLGAETRLLGAVGQDSAGDFMLDFLVGAGVNVGGVRREAGAPTGQAFITVDDAARNMIVVAAGANALYGAQAALSADLAGAKVILTQFEATLEAIEAIFRRPDAAGAIKILNTAPALSEGAALLALADLLILNETELASFAGLDAEPADASAALAAAQVLARPGQTVLATLGAAGAVAVRGDEAFQVPGLRQRAVDTTGAGDCFCGALAAGLSRGLTLPDAMAFANAAAALSVTRAGAAASMPLAAEVEALMAGA